MFSGAIVAIVTPFNNGMVDEDALRALIDFHIDSGIKGIVPCGTTGESATLSHKEHNHVIDIVVDHVSGRVPVIAGTGSNSTREAIRLTKHAGEAGADAALLITPYYNKPTQQGLYEHYRAIAEQSDIPLILYNVPSRTGVNMSANTTIRLAKIANIAGIKEASGDLVKCSLIARDTPEEFVLLSGEDALNLPIMSVGGKGAISVTANVLPAQMVAMMDAWEAGDTGKALKCHYELLEMDSAMFIETNPIPVKTALAMMGKIQEEFKLPLCPMSTDNKKRLAEVLKTYKCDIIAGRDL
ncbi:MAG: 4-hydroxy-tetrahydrodipicolinate synthase [Thermodesulfobacteriota bacterium]|nr:4-hydroxy-tetrahydrodipicolinate synthase [Thermodesulfobacteriota bacterium]